MYIIYIEYILYVHYIIYIQYINVCVTYRKFKKKGRLCHSTDLTGDDSQGTNVSPTYIEDDTFKALQCTLWLCQNSY
jgi:hypothetical protein